MNIAVCDDERFELDNINTLLSKYFNNKNEKVTIDVFCNGNDLIQNYECGNKYAIIFLDVIMPCITGIETAQEIRKKDKNVKIVFLTSSPEYAVDSYSVKACGYMLKPISEQKMVSFMDDLLREMEIDKESFYMTRTNDGLSRILLSNLEYCEIYNKTIYYHMVDKSVIEAIGSMNQLENDLCKLPQFYKSHRSYIINLNFVSTVTNDVVIMHSGGKIPVPYRKSNEIKAVTLEYFDFIIHCNKGVN